jgi:putative aldouronate transport system permease protein
MVHGHSRISKIFTIANTIFLGLLGVVCLFPFIQVFAVSLSSRAAAEGNLVSFWPIGFTTENYAQILGDQQFIHSTWNSLVRVVSGTSLNMFIVVLTAYPLSQDHINFWGKRPFKWLLIFALLFNGGLIPQYLVIRNLHMLDTMWALILPTAVQVFYIIVMMNFFRGLPRELSEAAAIDGASHWYILFRIFLPLSLPAIATLGLFSAVFHWNSWFDGLIYMNHAENYPLQSYLKTFLNTSSTGQFQNDPQLYALVSDQALRAAQIIVATIPIVMVYPFVQRYFVAGLTLGSVKE